MHQLQVRNPQIGTTAVAARADVAAAHAYATTMAAGVAAHARPAACTLKRNKAATTKRHEQRPEEASER